MFSRSWHDVPLATAVRRFFRRAGGGLFGFPAGDADADDGRRTIVAIAEIDRFQSLRRRVGYTVANGLVTSVGRRIRQELAGCRVGRVGRTSVEFAFSAPSRAAAEAQLCALAAVLERPVEVDGFGFDLSVTIGATDAGRRPVDDRLLDLAAAALADAQERHQKVRVVDETAQDMAGQDQLCVLRDLKRAMGSGELQLYYQPKLCSRTERVEAAEALLRWHHPERGLMRTDAVIEIAEETGAIRDLTRWVVERALRDHGRLTAIGHGMTLFVNISGVVLPDAGFASWALDFLARADGAIGFEITETAVIRDPEDAIANLQRFADAGIRIAIDDYGSGLSSLAYLKQLPAHELKIDRMFVSGLTESHRDPLLVRSSIDLAHALEMQVTAEGVDNPLSLSLLRVMGCDMVQGYLISEPLPLDAFVRFLGDDEYRTRLVAPTLGEWQLGRGRG